MGRLLAMARGALELARARLRHRKLLAREINVLNAEAVENGRDPADAATGDAKLVEQIAYVIPGVARRMPWRADCLVQAMAAQHWLITEGITATIVVGVHQSDSTGFGAHAWLTYGDFVVTGGQTSHYTVMIKHESKP